MRTNLFFKVEIEHGTDDELRLVTTQIARQIEKIYGVRSAELSSASSEE